ncbi:capsular polysaccharide transport system permease protein [Jannaschia faecimaris]|uniref:Transport permease protein n=1 Tax=Jannaschia faecimaris TaxID=1244108 RepID=A0A1H3K5V1_9RHOB|nr:ABC transporter permease [Jannaschia faecimaris]SDY47580.1 capsular polysaccharide transport system permease protein [Jannaschia faecimaris]
MTAQAPFSPQAPAKAASSKRRFASLRAVVALMLREMATTHGRSPGGYAWAVLEPVAGIALLSLVFSVAFRAPALGVSFPMFYATGMLPFLMFNAVANTVSQSLNFSRPLLAYPTVTFVDALIGRFLLNTMTQLMVAYVLLSGIFFLFDTRVTPDYSIIVEAFTLAALLAGGIGVLNAFLVGRFPIWQQAWSIIMRPMFLISCIFFLFETVPQPYRDWIWWNPLVHIVGLMRRGFYGTYDATYVSPVYVMVVGLVALMLGLVFLRRYHRDLLNR